MQERCSTTCRFYFVGIKRTRASVTVEWPSGIVDYAASAHSKLDDHGNGRLRSLKGTSDCRVMTTSPPVGGHWVCRDDESRMVDRRPIVPVPRLGYGRSCHC